MNSNLCFEEGEFILLLIKQGKDYESNYFDIIVIKSRRFTCISKQTKLFYNFGSQDKDKKNQDWSRYKIVDRNDLLQNTVQPCPNFETSGSLKGGKCLGKSRDYISSTNQCLCV